MYSHAVSIVLSLRMVHGASAAKHAMVASNAVPETSLVMLRLVARPAQHWWMLLLATSSAARATLVRLAHSANRVLPVHISRPACLARQSASVNFVPLVNSRAMKDRAPVKHALKAPSITSGVARCAWPVKWASLVLETSTPSITVSLAPLASLLPKVPA